MRGTPVAEEKFFPPRKKAVKLNFIKEDILMKKKQCMKFVFEHTAKHTTENTICSDRLKDLPDIIQEHSGWNYLYKPTENGCFLETTSRNNPYINSFAPEIDIVVSYNGNQTVFDIKGQPVKFVRWFMTFWFGSALMMQFLVLAFALEPQEYRFIHFVPLYMCIFAYCLCRFATKRTFDAVIKAIEKEFP